MCDGALQAAAGEPVPRVAGMRQLYSSKSNTSNTLESLQSMKSISSVLAQVTNACMMLFDQQSQCVQHAWRRIQRSAKEKPWRMFCYHLLPSFDVRGPGPTMLLVLSVRP